MPPVFLPRALEAWHTPAFPAVLKAELEGLPADTLPLQHCTTQGGRVDAGGVTVSLLAAQQTPTQILARVAVFFTELVGGCSCGDDLLAVPARCEILVILDREGAAASFEIRN